MYRIGELAKMAEVTPDTIRYYEKQQMLEEMYKLDYFSRRPIFGSVAKDGAIFHYVQRADEK